MPLLKNNTILSEYLSSFIVFDYKAVNKIIHDHYLVESNVKHELVKDVYVTFDVDKNPKLLTVIPFLHQDFSREHLDLEDVFTDFDNNRKLLVYYGYLLAALKRIVMLSLSDDIKCSVALRLLDEWNHHIDLNASSFNVRIVFGDLLKVTNNDWKVQNRIFLWYEWMFKSKVVDDFYPLTTENFYSYINQSINLRQLLMSLAFCPRYFMETKTKHGFIKLYSQLLKLDPTEELTEMIFELKELLPKELIDSFEWSVKYNTPVTLKALSRSLIREMILSGSTCDKKFSDNDFIHKVKQLPLPETLIKYLRYF